MIEIAIYDLEGNFLSNVSAENMYQLSLSLEVDSNTLKRVLDGYAISCGGYQCKRISEHVSTPRRLGEVWHLSSRRTPHLRSGLIVKAYAGRAVATYHTQMEAAEKNQLDVAAISRCLNGQAKTTGGYGFYYLSASPNES